MNTLTQSQLNAIKERTEMATSGPWRYGLSAGLYSTGTKDSVLRAWQQADILGKDSDAEFIAHAREDIPALVAEVERLRRKSELYRKCNQQKDAIISEKDDEILRLSQTITAKADANLSLAKIAIDSFNKDAKIANLRNALQSACSSLGADISDYYYEEDSE